MACPQCRSINPPEARFCFRCGTALLPDGAGPEPASPAAPVYNYAALPGLYPPADYRPTPPGHPLLELHPLAARTGNLPFDLLQQPRRYYSYVNPQGRLVFARRASFQARLGAAVLDLLALSLPLFLVLAVFNAATLESGANAGPALTADGRLDQAQSGWTQLLLYSLTFGYFYLTGVTRGQSLGQRAVRIRVMQFDGRKPGPLTALLRYLPGFVLSSNILLVSLVALVAGSFTAAGAGTGAAVGALAFGWGFWWCAWDPLRQGWHDKLARTLVVDAGEYTEGLHFYRY